MSKSIVIGIVSVGGAGAVGIGGYALFGNGFGFGGSSDSPAQPSTSESNTSGSTTTVVTAPPSIPKPNLGTINQTTFSKSSTAGNSTYDEQRETVDGITTVTGGPCFKEVFADNFSLATSDSDTTITISDITFGTPESNKKSGCLWVQTKKVEFGNSSSKTYTGVFSWAWAFKGATKGLVVFGSAKAETTGKLSSEGVMYLLKKENESGSVEKKQKSEVKEISSSNDSGSDYCRSIGKKLPEANNSKISGSINNCYWSWLDEGELKDKISTDTAASGKATTDLHLYSWTYGETSNNDAKKAYDCFKDPQLGGLDHLFNNAGSQLKTKLESWDGKGSS